jgi:hypothetical protein
VNRLTAAVTAVLIGILLVACGSSSASSSGATASASPTQVASPSASGSAPASAGNELEALIPDKIGTVTLQKQAFSGRQFVGSGGASQEAQDFLNGLGVATDDVTVAVGFGIDPGSSALFAELLFRAEGASSDRLLSLFKQAADSQQDSPLEWQSVQVGGKSVEKAANPVQQGGSSVYLYATGDLLAYITASSDDQASEALSALP